MKMLDGQARGFIGPSAAIVKKQEQGIVARAKHGMPVWLA